MDALRGACFVFMTVDHFPASPVSRFSNAYFGPFGLFRLSVIELGPLRLVDFAAFGFLLYVVVQAVPPTHLRWRAARWLAFIGRNSLPVFVWSIAITYLATALLPVGLDCPESVVALTLVVASLSIPALVRSRIRDQRFPTIRAGAEPAGTFVASPQRRL